MYSVDASHTGFGTKDSFSVTTRDRMSDIRAVSKSHRRIAFVGQAFQPDAGACEEECQAGKPDVRCAIRSAGPLSTV